MTCACRNASFWQYRISLRPITRLEVVTWLSTSNPKMNSAYLKADKVEAAEVGAASLSRSMLKYRQTSSSWNTFWCCRENGQHPLHIRQKTIRPGQCSVSRLHTYDSLNNLVNFWTCCIMIRVLNDRFANCAGHSKNVSHFMQADSNVFLRLSTSEISTVFLMARKKATDPGCKSPLAMPSNSAATSWPVVAPGWKSLCCSNGGIESALSRPSSSENFFFAKCTFPRKFNVMNSDIAQECLTDNLSELSWIQRFGFLKCYASLRRQPRITTLWNHLKR